MIDVMFGMCVMAVAVNEVPQPVAARVADRLQWASPGAVQVEGFLGRRVERNRTGRLTHAPMDEMLDGFRHRPGNHAWIGEHIGKWLHAAVLTWQYSGDEKLKSRIDQAVRDLLATQKEDGYLGTYEDKDRWTSWDVWVHKYNLIGLMAYYRATGDPAALRGAGRVGDLLVDTFGADKRDIIESGTHKGMAATSVLEPMVLLYRATGDERFLAFCKYLVESWDQPHGPKVLSSLLAHGKVNRTANRKAYEMMSNLVGLCELYRVVGDARFLEAACNGWDDIEANQVFITGGTSLGEHFQPDGHLPDTGAIAETCANVTWMQLSMALFALTGETKYADAVERLIYNHLLGAQAEDGHDWCYFTELVGAKKFTQNVNCCHSSGPRGVAMIPTFFYSTASGGARINLYGPSRFKGEIPGVGPVEIRQQTQYPSDGRIAIEVLPDKPASFRLELRIPPWSRNYRLAVNGEPIERKSENLAVLERQWRSGDRVSLDLDVAPRWIRGCGEHEGKMAAAKGPLVLCASPRWNPTLPSPRLIGVTDAPTFEPAGEIAGLADEEKGLLAAFAGKVLTSEGVRDMRVVLGPFACVQKEKVAVWMREAQLLPKTELSLTFDGEEGWSRGGGIEGSIADGDPTTHRVTQNGRLREEDWWQVTVSEPVEARRIVFRHGQTSDDGGWFDTSAGKPEVFILTEKDGQWKPVGRLETYPQTTADKPPRLENGQPFELVIPPTRIYGVRVVGKPACGDKPRETFSSCAELAAFDR